MFLVSSPILRRMVLILLSFCCLLPSLEAADAALIGDTTRAFSADRLVISNGKSYLGRVYAIPGRQRHEQMLNGLHPIALLRADQALGWLILPELRIYTRFAFPESVLARAEDDHLGPVLGQEIVSGLATSKYRVHQNGQDGSALDGYLWRSKDGVIVQMEGSYRSPSGRETHASMRLSHIVFGPQDPHLFELPSGLTALPPEALQPLLNIK